MVTARVVRMTASDTQIGISGTAVDVLAAVDERQLVLVQRLHDQLDPDEPEHDREAEAEVDQPLQQAADEEVELPQAHQREDVGGEDQVGLLGEPVDRRDRVQREQQVGRAQREDDDQHRGDDPLAVDPGDELDAVPLLGGREPPLDPLQQPVLLEVLLVRLALGGQLDGGVDEEGAEEVEDPAEVLDRRRADGDEDPAHHQGQDDADQQGRLLQRPGHREPRHDDDEDEQVVDRQAVLREPAGVELARVPRRRRSTRTPMPKSTARPT